MWGRNVRELPPKKAISIHILLRFSQNLNKIHWVCDGAVGEVVEVLSFRTAVRGGGMHFVHD